MYILCGSSTQLSPDHVSPDHPATLMSLTKQRENTGTCVARRLTCKTPSVKCTLLDTPAVLAVAEDTNEIDSAATQPKLCRRNAPSDLSEFAAAVPAVAEDTNEIDSAATQPKLRRMNASSDLSEYAAECSQNVESQCGNEAGAADSPDSAEHIWQPPLPESEGSSDNGTSDESDINMIEDKLADRFRRAAQLIEERRPFITQYHVRSNFRTHVHMRYYIKGREIPKDYFERVVPRKRLIPVINIGEAKPVGCANGRLVC